jgi:hypothetical protein
MDVARSMQASSVQVAQGLLAAYMWQAVCGTVIDANQQQRLVDHIIKHALKVCEQQ